MKKECEVIMLPTKRATWPNCIWLGRISKQLRLDKSYSSYYDCDPIDDSMLPQHLYITSDDEIKKGDWVFIPEHFIGPKYTISRIDSLDSIKGLNAKKIIATTDLSLSTILEPHINKYGNFRYTDFLELPKPSEPFIKKYIKEYNKGNQIIKVMVEYEAILDGFEGFEWIVKVDKLNEVSISKVIRDLNIEEVRLIVSNFAKDFANDNNLDLMNSLTYTTNWLNKNL